MKKLLFCMLLLILIGFSCVAAIKPAPENLISGLKQKDSVTICYYSARPLSILTIKDITGSGLAAKLSKTQNLPYGSALMETYKIKNPMEQVAQKTVIGLLNNGIKNINFIKAPYPLNDENNTPGYNFDTTYLLEIKPRVFSSGYLSLNWQTYWINITAEAKLTRLKDKEQVWLGVGAGDGAMDKRLRLDVTEFEKDEAKRLKEVIELSATECSNKIVEQFLNKK